MDDDLLAAFRRVPLLAGLDPASARRLGGLTNRNYILDHVGPAIGERYVLRVAGAGTAEYIDRTTEEVAARAAADAGVNAEVLFFDSSDGLMVTRFVEGATTMSPAGFAADPAAVQRAGQVFRRLHTTSAPFATDFQLLAMIDQYKSLLATKRATLPDGFEEVQRRAGAARRALQHRPVRLVASHCDPLCENFLDTGERMWLIDYEYAGNNDPMWDLGDLSVEAGFTEDQDRQLLTAYFGGEPPPDHAARMTIYQAMCDLLWTLWGVIQHVGGNPVDDFWAYATRRFQRCQSLMRTPRFAEAVTRLGVS